jgi:hypothetical protein
MTENINVNGFGIKAGTMRKSDAGWGERRKKFSASALY